MSGKYKMRLAICFQPGCSNECEPRRRLCPEHQLCTASGCQKPKANGLLCATHKKHARRERLRDTVCSVEACESPIWYVTKGLCHKHGTDRTRDRRRDITAARKEQMRVATLRRKYNITPADYGQLLMSQGGACAICCQPESDNRALAVDHDHSCCPGEKSCGACVRGLLCRACNTALGLLRDDRAVVTAALVYLQPKRRLGVAS